MCQHKAPHGKWEPALRHLSDFDDAEIPEPPTLFDDYAGRSAAAAGHEMGIAEDIGPSRLMFRYSSKFTPEQFKVFDAYFRPRNEAFRNANLTGEASHAVELSTLHQELPAVRQGGRRECRPHAQVPRGGRSG